MPQVVFLFENAPAKRTVTAARGTPALEAARRAGVEIRTPCGGSGMCGKCRVRVKGETVLACQYRVVSDTEITVPKNRDDDKTLRILTDGQSFTHDRAPFITKRFSGGTTRVYGGADLIGSEDGDTSEETYGLALDIGTTTLVLSLVD
ncbi:MAG: 2Fe-2S iron-sulfur cluster binding domain-containing protein, partial [Spirochaetaceae bacterium]|nr:2Fe-2S iron-sulfur cluster binding domain-containing protein [Spirochaetaceae bacterium]